MRLRPTPLNTDCLFLDGADSDWERRRFAEEHTADVAAIRLRDVSRWLYDPSRH
jgi:hypothetical protein